jgi:hypothetical protein
MRLSKIKFYLLFHLVYLMHESLQTFSKANNCKIKMAMNRMAFVKADDKLIFNEGILNSDVYGENSTHAFTSPFENEIEYFYIFEDKIVNVHNHDKIVLFYYNK